MKTAVIGVGNMGSKYTGLIQTGEYVAGAGENPYGFEKAFLDVKMGKFE